MRPGKRTLNLAFTKRASTGPAAPAAMRTFKKTFESVLMDSPHTPYPFTCILPGFLLPFLHDQQFRPFATPVQQESMHSAISFPACQAGRIVFFHTGHLHAAFMVVYPQGTYAGPEPYDHRKCTSAC